MQGEPDTVAKLLARVRDAVHAVIAGYNDRRIEEIAPSRNGYEWTQRSQL